MGASSNDDTALAGLLQLRDHAASMSSAQLSLLRFHAHLAHHVARSAAKPVLQGEQVLDGGTAGDRSLCTEDDLCRLLRLCLTNTFAVREETGSGSSSPTSAYAKT